MQKIQHRYRFPFIAIVVIAIFSMPITAQAQRIKDLFDKEMPPFTHLPEEEFLAQTYLQKDIPYNDKALAYEIRLPNGWEQPADASINNMNLSNKLLGEVALFYSPPKIETLRSKFQIFALALEYDITAEQWLMQHVLSNGFTLEGIEFFDENKVGALYIYLENGETFIVRSISQINGKRMILTQYVIPIKSWAAESSIVSQSLASFKLLSPEKDVAIESTATHQFLDIAEFSFPESWSLTSRAVRSVDRMDVSVNNIRKNETKVLDGQIEVAMVSAYTAKDIEKEIEDVKVIYRRKGLVINDLMETMEDYQFSPEADFGFVDIYKANDPNNSRFDYEVWVGIMSIGSYYFYVSMMTPGRDYDFFTWSRNANAFKTVVRSASMQEKNIAID